MTYLFHSLQIRYTLIMSNMPPRLYLFLLVVIALSSIIGAVYFLSRNGITSLVPPPSLTSDRLCTKGFLATELRNFFTLKNNKEVDLYSELLDRRAHCDKNNKLLNSQGKEIYILQRNDCTESSASTSAFITTREKDSQAIENLKNIYDLIIIECPQISPLTR